MGEETLWWTDNTTQREMTLDEWCATLPEGHRARLELTRLRTALAAAERVGDDDGDGEYILSLQRQLAEVKAQLDAALKAVDVTPFTEEIRRLAALVAAVPDALTEARRDGAELALGVVFESDPLAAKQVLAALFPPPGAEVGRG